MKSFIQYINEQDAPPAAPPPPMGGGAPPPMGGGAPPMGGGAPPMGGGATSPQAPAKKIQAVSVWSSLKKLLDGDKNDKSKSQEKKPQ